MTFTPHQLNGRSRSRSGSRQKLTYTRLRHFTGVSQFSFTSITNDKQAVSEELNSQIWLGTATESATVTVKTLPDGVMYDSNSKSIRHWTYMKDIVIPVAAKDGGFNY